VKYDCRATADRSVVRQLQGATGEYLGRAGVGIAAVGEGPDAAVRERDA
jgi:hypothetical protein